MNFRPSLTVTVFYATSAIFKISKMFSTHYIKYSYTNYVEGESSFLVSFMSIFISIMNFNMTFSNFDLSMLGHCISSFTQKNVLHSSPYRPCFPNVTHKSGPPNYPLKKCLVCFFLVLYSFSFF